MHKSIVFVVRVRCRRKESSRSLSHLLMIIGTADPLCHVVFVTATCYVLRRIFYNVTNHTLGLSWSSARHLTGNDYKSACQSASQLSS